MYSLEVTGEGCAVVTDQKFGFIGGSLCLDFANTFGGARGQIGAIEHLNSYGDLLNWARQAGLVSDDTAGHLDLESRNPAAGTVTVLERARRLREAIYSLFSATTAQMPPPEKDLAVLNVELARALKGARVIATPEGYAWGWTAEERLDAMLAAVARSSADLLTSPALPRVRECASSHCTWLFLDQTKNHSRRWCDMRTCGNVHKVRRFRSHQAREG